MFVADDDPSGATVRYRTYGGYCNPAECAAAGLLWQNQQY